MCKLSFLIFTICLIYSLHADPVNNNFFQVQGSTINSTSNKIFAVFYSPDLKSFVAVQSLNETKLCAKFQSGIIQEEQSQQICIDGTVVNAQYSPQGDRFYILTQTWDNKNDHYTVSYWKIENGFVKGNATTLYNLSNPNDQKNLGSSQIIVGRNRNIAITGKNKIFILKCDQKDVCAQQSFPINVDYIQDFKWHPVDYEIAIMGCCVNEFNSITAYNTTSKNFIYKKILQGSFSKINLVMNGSIIIIGEQMSTKIYSAVDLYQSQDPKQLASKPNYFIRSENPMNSQAGNIIYLFSFNETTNVSKVHFYSLNLSNVSTKLMGNSKMLNNSQQKITLTEILTIQYPANQSKTAFYCNGVVSSDDHQIYFNNYGDIHIKRWARCQNGQYQSNGQCLGCPSTCQYCHKSGNECLTCNTDRFYSNQACTACNQKFSGCGACTFGVCTSCQDGKSLNQGTHTCESSLSTGALIGIIAGGVVFLILVGVGIFCACKRCKKNKGSEYQQIED